MEALKKTLGESEIDMAEKCRRLLEALKVEAEYGRTVEVYQETICLPGEGDPPPIAADILRVGRLALFWRTPDGHVVGHWNRAEASWERLPDKDRRHINEAMEMALRRRTVEMVNLPLGRIVVP